MKDYLQDLITHTNGLGDVDLIKVSGTDTETHINAISEKKTVIVSGVLNGPISDFIGVFGMPNLTKLKTVLGFDDYDEHAKISVVRTTRDGVDVPTTIHFETKDGTFVNDYRLMTKSIVEEKVKTVTFKGTTWNIEFEPTLASIQRLKLQAAAHTEETVFTVKTENKNLMFYFGDANSHAGSFIFQANVVGELKQGWSWPIQQVISILNLDGKIKMSLSDQGAMQLTVDSGIAEYNYILPAQTK